MSTIELFRKVERILHDKLPTKIDQILFNAGFDSETALLALNHENIAEAERYINENKQILIGTSYASFCTENSVFKFKPGHKATILSIAKALKESKSTNKKKKKCESEPLDDEKLKQALITKVFNFANKQSFELLLETSDIIDFKREEDKIKSRIQCPYCPSLYKCEFTSYWNISNFEKHLKKHFANGIELLEVPVENETVAKNTDQILFISTDQTAELDEVLNN